MIEMEIRPLTKEELIAQKECCGNGCLNCPYIPKHTKGSKFFPNIYIGK